MDKTHIIEHFRDQLAREVIGQGDSLPRFNPMNVALAGHEPDAEGYTQGPRRVGSAGSGDLAQSGTRPLMATSLRYGI